MCEKSSKYCVHKELLNVNQTLTSDLAKLGYTDQISVDFSYTIITQMQSKYPDLEWRVDDVRHLQLDDRTVNVAIDKGTMDAMLYGSPWDPPEEVRDNVAKYVGEVARILRPGGRSRVHSTLELVISLLKRRSGWSLHALLPLALLPDFIHGMARINN